MDGTRLFKAESIFHDLVGRDGPQRASLLATRCGGDAELRRLVEQLLSNDDSGMDGFLREPAFAGPAADPQPAAPAIPHRIGKYEIVTVLGEGGMGIVYEARQENPSRTVALKVIRTALPSRETFRRFRHEAEILAQLQHPGIAHVYEAGVAVVGPDDGLNVELPYFAMELVRGKPLREYAESSRLNVRGKLTLIAQVCDAVQHAHEKGIIHRDLKSDNLLVENSGQPRILDFGVARLITPPGESATQHTRAGEIIGTLAYMSPEQIAGDQGLIDTRSDIYSLGVILYELLSGKLPHDVRGLPLTEAARRIRDDDPPAVSSLARGLRGDVETIVAKAMHKDRARRYESVAALAADVRRHLRLEPIAARSDSAVYMLRKTLRRYRWPVAAAAAFVLGLSAFSAYAWLQAERQRQLTGLEQAARQRAESATEQARLAEQSERTQRSAAEAAAEKALAAERAQASERLRAEREAQRAGSVTTFLVDTLGLADPDLTQSADMTMKTALDRAAAQVGGRFADQPESEASVQLVIGRAYATLGELDAAVEHLGRAVEIHELQLDSQPEVLYEALWPYLHVLDELGHPNYRNRWWQMYDLYPKLFLRASAELSAVQFKLRAQLGEKYEPQKAEPLYAEFRSITDGLLRPDDPLWLVIADFFHQGGANLALKEHPGIGCTYLREALAIERRILPETNTRIIRTLGELIRATLDAGLFAEAEALTRESLTLMSKSLPEEHWYMAVNRARRGAALVGQGRFDEGEKLLLENLAQIEALRGTTNGFAREIAERLIDVYESAGKTGAAEQWRESLARRIVSSRQYNRPLRQLKRVFRPQHADLYDVLERFAREGMSRAGVEAMHELIPLRRERYADGDVRSALIAECLCSVGNEYADRRGVNRNTLTAVTEAERIARACESLHPRKHAWIYWNLGRNLEPGGHYADAERQARDAIDILDRHFGPQDRLAVEARSLLGGCLTGHGCLDEAEPLLLAAFELQIASFGPKNYRTHDTMKRLIRLYEATGSPDAALPYVYAVARDQYLPWSETKPVLAALYPAVADALDELNKTQADDVDGLKRAIRAALEARSAVLEPSDPAALVYAGAICRMARPGLYRTYHPVWLPLLREINEINLQHMSADDPDVGSIVWWLATLMIRRGDYVEAQVQAAEALRLERIQNPDNREAVSTRIGLVAGSLLGQGHVAEAGPLLLSAFDGLFEADVPRQPYFTECFGYMVDLYSRPDRPEEALRRIEAVLRREIDLRRNAVDLHQLSYHVLCRPELPAELYELARQAAQIATEVRKTAHFGVLVAAANYRLGRFDEALQGLENLDSVQSGDAIVQAAFLAMAQFRLDRGDLARSALARARSHMQNRADVITVQEQRLVAEAERLMGQ